MSEITKGTRLLQVRAGGEEVFRETVPLDRQDFVRAELVIFPLAFVLLPGLFGFTSTGSLDPSIPILMLCVAYACP